MTLLEKVRLMFAQDRFQWYTGQGWSRWAKSPELQFFDLVNAGVAKHPKYLLWDIARRRREQR